MEIKMSVSKKIAAVLLIVTILFGAFSLTEASNVYASQKITISKSKAVMEVGTTLKLSLNNLPDGAQPSWHSKDVTVAKIDNQTGRVTALSEGNVRVYAKYNGHYYRCDITVYNNNIVKLSKTSLTMEKGSRYTISLDNIDENETVKWYSKNKEIATVDETAGRIYARNAGRVIIYAKEGGKTYSCALLVMDSNNFSTLIQPIISGGEKYYSGYLDPRTALAAVIKNYQSIDALVNKYYAMPESYVPELVTAEYANDGQLLCPECEKAWVSMRNACLKATGIEMYIINGYRSLSVQTASFNRAVINKGVARAAKYYAYPARSDHELGLGMDIGNVGETPEDFDFLDTESGKWMENNAYKYGFILRYPEDKETITGYGFEAWHFRYVGIYVATYCYKHNYTLEEYYGLTGAIN
jgi:LAS superfamily LD-carboxypeptidase LdcB